MNTTGVPESPLKKEGRLFSEWLTRFANAVVNRIFDLSPQASAIRSVWIVILFFLTGFVISLVYYPLGLWFQRIQDIFLFVFNSAYRATYQGDPLLSLVSFAWQVFIDPRNLHFLPLMLASFFISLQSAAIYLADIFEIEDVSIARNHVFEVALSGSDDVIRISEGEVLEEHRKSPNFLIGGPGRIIVDLDSAALFEKPDGTPHVIGPTAGGRAVIEGFERFREAIDLRDHFIDLRDRDDKSRSVNSRSRDGLPIAATDVSFIFSIHRTVDEKEAEIKPARKGKRQTGLFSRKAVEKEPVKETKKDPDPYPFSKKAVENIVYKAASQVTPDQINPSTYKFSWINNMTGLVRSELGGFMAKRDLTVYLASTNYPERDRAVNRENEFVEQARRVIPPHEDPPQPQNVPPVPDFTPRYKITDLFNEFTSDFTKKARERGVELRWIGIGTWQTPIPNVIDKHLEAWKISRENQGNGSDGAMNALRHETALTRSLELIQEIPLGSYHQALERTRNPLRVMFGVVVDFHKQLNQAKDLYIHKRETPPNVLGDAIRLLDNIVYRFRQNQPPFQEDEVTAEEVQETAGEPESAVPGPGEVAFDELVRLVGGDVAEAKRRIENEQIQFPNDPPEILIERAIDRLDHDRQG